jgi:hypothetical protein
VVLRAKVDRGTIFRASTYFGFASIREKHSVAIRNLPLIEEAIMNWKKYWIMLMGLGLLAISGAVAEQKAEHNITITDPVQIGSRQLEPGHYKVEWQGEGPTVQVQFLHNGKPVASSNAQLVNQNQKSPYDDVVTIKAGTNASSLKEIDFHNEAESLVFANQPGL